MGLMDELKKLTKPYADDEYMDDEAVDPAPSRSLFSRRDSRSYASYAEAPAPAESAPRRSIVAPPRSSEGKVVNLGGAAGGQPMKLLVMKPERFEDAAGIADHMRQRCSIVLNLEETPKEVARRLVDFVSGAAYALDGRIKRIAAGTYIITPANVDLMGDELEALSGSKEMYF